VTSSPRQTEQRGRWSLLRRTSRTSKKSTSRWPGTGFAYGPAEHWQCTPCTLCWKWTGMPASQTCLPSCALMECMGCTAFAAARYSLSLSHTHTHSHTRTPTHTRAHPPCFQQEFTTQSRPQELPTTIGPLAPPAATVAQLLPLTCTAGRRRAEAPDPDCGKLPRPVPVRGGTHRAAPGAIQEGVAGVWGQ